MKPVPTAASFDLLIPRADIRGDSTLAVVRDASFDRLTGRLEGSIVANDRVIEHVLDIVTLLRAIDIEKGFHSCINEVFIAYLAAQLLKLDAGFAHVLPCWTLVHVLPCWTLVHDKGAVITVTTPMPSALMTEFSHSADVAQLARTFEHGLQRVLQGVI